jgi:IS5 family transposase
MSVLCHGTNSEVAALTHGRREVGGAGSGKLASAVRVGAARPADFTQVIVDTTVPEKAISFATDARLMHRARERLVRLAWARGIKLRQSYARVGKFALIATLM